jgi:hypothetical protein
MGLSTVMVWGAAIFTFIIVVIIRAGEIDHKAGRGSVEKHQDRD